jgi:hypothetical protein
MMPAFATRILLLAAGLCVLRGAENVRARDDLYTGWMRMYDLKFDEAHDLISRWQRSHPTDPLGPVAHAGGYLFAEFERLGVLESELFVDDKKFIKRKKLQPDPEAKRRFLEQVGKSEALTNTMLLKSPNDKDALLAKSLALGLRADYASLIEKQNLESLSLTKESRIYAEKLLAVDPNAYDAYLSQGIENYILSLKIAPVRWVLGWTGANTDREKGIEQLKLAAAHGHYLEPFAKLLLAVAALRAKDKPQAQKLLQELHTRFPGNTLYAHELDHLNTALGSR